MLSKMLRPSDLSWDLLIFPARSRKQKHTLSPVPCLSLRAQAKWRGEEPVFWAHREGFWRCVLGCMGSCRPEPGGGETFGDASTRPCTEPCLFASHDGRHVCGRAVLHRLIVRCMNVCVRSCREVSSMLSLPIKHSFSTPARIGINEPSV